MQGRDVPVQNLKQTMEEAKKSKRPRIGAPGLNMSSSENGENESRYEKVNYPSDSTRQQREDGQEHGAYQQRPYGYNRNNAQGGYARQGGYQQRPQGYGQNNYNRQGGYQQNRQNGYQNRQGGYGQNNYKIGRAHV